MSGLLRVKDVRKCFGGLVAVNNISLTVGEGEIVAVIGPNGAGKSTLFNVISGEIAADSGEIWMGNQRIDCLAPFEIISFRIARTYQHVHLVPELTVLENAMLGAHARTKRGFISAGIGFGAEEEHAMKGEASRQLSRLGLQDHLDKPATSLALGQQRLVEIARALCAEPRLLLLDEPAAGLRYGEKKELANLLQKLRESGMSVLLVEHDMTFVMGIADRVVVMNFGEKLTEGDPVQVRENSKVQEAYLGGVSA